MERLIYVYKIRTMHPYSEYLQQYLIEISGYDSKEGKGKLKDDFSDHILWQNFKEVLA